ncbi:DUF664 domain-containing protein [Rhodococcus sp. O3]|uniref:mycothiol transferase n=1 Tax=Rhodococcus sp. O3 TaxID=3404919 RepID=UPI003B66D9A4
MSIPTESDLLLKILGNQHDAFRNAVSGLTDEQARSVPSASSMSLASLLAHVVDGEVAAADRLAGTNSRPDDPVEAWTSGWLVGDDETVTDQIAKLDAAAARLAQLVRDEPNLDRVVDIPDDVARYLGQGVPFTVRFLLLHQIEEWARHAGHADIIRESIDGATADVLAGQAW